MTTALAIVALIAILVAWNRDATARGAHRSIEFWRDLNQKSEKYWHESNEERWRAERRAEQLAKELTRFGHAIPEAPKERA